MAARLKGWLEKWGYYILATLCAGTVLFSSAWTNSQTSNQPGLQAAVDQGDKLSDIAVKATEEPRVSFDQQLTASVIKEYSEAPVYNPFRGVWTPHLGVDFACEKGAEVRALAEGIVELAQGGKVIVRHDLGWESSYETLARIDVEAGERVKRGEALGAASGSVPCGGSEESIHIVIMKDGLPMNIAADEP